MTACTNVRNFVKANDMRINATGGQPMLSKPFTGGAMWIECFDSYADAWAYITKAREAYTLHNKPLPWSVANYK